MQTIKTTFIVLFLLLISNGSTAQVTSSLTINESSEYKDSANAPEVIGIYTSENGETIVVRSGNKDFLFDTFDKNLNKTFSKTIKSNRKEEHVGDLFYHDKLKLFTVDAPTKDERIIYCHTLDLASKSYNKTVVFETTVDKKQSLFGSRKRHNTNFALSPNGNYFAIATDNIRKNKNAYTIRVFNAGTEELIFKKSYQESEKLFFQHNDLYVNDSGAVFTLGKLYSEGKWSSDSKGDANYNYLLYKITEDENQKLVLEMDHEHIQSLNIAEVNNELHLLGFFSEEREGKVKGGCNFLIDTENLNVKSKKTLNLPDQVYKDLYGYRKAERKNKKKKELKNFEVDYVLSDNNGGTYLIAEEFYVTTTYVQNGMGGYWQTVFHYDDLLILKFNSDGDLSWGRSVFKRSTTPSYNAFVKDDKLHVILNSGKNLTEKSDERTKVSKSIFESSALYDFEYDADGAVAYNKIQDNKGNNFYLPYYGTYENNKFIMVSSGKKKKAFMTLE